MSIQKTDHPDTKLTPSERIQLTAAIAINNTLNTLCHLAHHIRSLGR